MQRLAQARTCPTPFLPSPCSPAPAYPSHGPPNERIPPLSSLCRQSVPSHTLSLPLVLPRSALALAAAAAPAHPRVPSPGFDPQRKHSSQGSRRTGRKKQSPAVPRHNGRSRTSASLQNEDLATLVQDLRGTNIFLVGMMGSGKSTVGRILARSLGYCFFDSDEVVEQAAGGATVAQIFAENGEEAFRDLETKVLSELSSLGRLVVSTGGGAILRRTNWSYMDHGITVFIDVPVPVLASRVVASGTSSRPLLGSSADDADPSASPSNSLPAAVAVAAAILTPEDGPRTGSAAAPRAEDQQEQQLLEAEARLQDIFRQREALYRNADTTVSLQQLSNSKGTPCDNLSAEDIADEVLVSISNMVAERKQRDRKAQARVDC